MKTIKIDLARELNAVELIPLADLHIGDCLCDMDLIKSKIEYIKNTENAFCVLNGDLINNSTKNSVGDVYSEELTPMKQLETIVELFEPIKEKILAVTYGNHEARTWKYDGVDLSRIVAVQLGLEDRYARESAIIFLRFGTESRGHKESKGSGRTRMIAYTIFVTHGSGGGRKEGAKAIRLADMASIIDADIYIHSHTHLPMIMKQKYHRIDTRNNAVALVDKLFVNTSSFLNYGGYGEAFEFKPASKDTPHIFLSGHRKHYSAKL